MEGEFKKKKSKKKRKIIYLFLISIIVLLSFVVLINFNQIFNYLISDIEWTKLSPQSKEVVTAISKEDISTRGFDFGTEKDGIISVRTPRGELVGDFGVAISGDIDGRIFLYTTKDFVWNKIINKNLINITKTINSTDDRERNVEIKIDESYYVYNVSLLSNNTNLIWRQDYYFSKDYPKIKNTITNNIGDITNLTIWNLIELDRDTEVRYNNRILKSELNRNIDVELSSTAPHEIEIGDFKINFGDMLQNNFKLTNIYIGDGNRFGIDKRVVALGVSTINSRLSNRGTLIIDPVILTAGLNNPAASGQNLTNGWDQWTNGSGTNVLTSDNTYASYNLAVGLWKNLSIGNFSLLESEGGDLPLDAIVQGIQVNIEGRYDSCPIQIPPGPPCDLVVLGIGYSFDGDNSVNYETMTGSALEFDRSTTDSIQSLGDVSPGGTYKYLTNREPKVKPNDLSNANFRIRLFPSYQSAGNGTIYIDNVQVKVSYTLSVTNTSISTIDTEAQNTEDLVSLLFSDSTLFINQSNILLYLPMDWEDIKNTSNVYHAVELSQWDMTNALSHKLPYTTGIYGGAYTFLSAQKNYIEAMTLKRDYSQLFQGETISAWIRRINDDSIQTMTIIDESHSTVVQSRLAVRTDKLRFSAKNDTMTLASSPILCAGTTLIPNGIWTHAAATYNGTTVSLYVNGVLDTSCTTLKGNLNRGTQEWRVGCQDDNTYTNCWDGDLDEIMVLDTWLNSTQISNIYNNNSARFFSRGEKIINNLNIGTNTTINISTSVSLPKNTKINLTIGNSSGGTYVYGQQFVYNGSLNNTLIGTPTNFSVKYILLSDSNNMFSPIINNSVDYVAFGAPVSNTCSYTSGNWNILCSDNCVITSNNIINLNSNVSVTGDGTFTINGGNITNYKDFVFGSTGGYCNGTIINGGQIYGKV